MKKCLLSVVAFVCLAGCGNADTYNNNRETRYFAYVGEPAAVLYDNFGTPYKGIKYSDTERALIFHTQDFEREWAYTDYRYCDITFFLTNDIVTGWEMNGNQCAINEEDTGIFSGFFSGGSVSGGVPSDAFTGSPVLVPNGAAVPNDAFGLWRTDAAAYTNSGATQFDFDEDFIADQPSDTQDADWMDFDEPEQSYTAPQSVSGHRIAADAF